MRRESTFKATAGSEIPHLGGSFRTELSHVQLGVGGKEEPFDYVVLALPFDGLASILPNTSASQPLRDSLSCFETSPITGIHLWFDREISELEHAVLLDRTIQWMFHKSKLQKRGTMAMEATWNWWLVRRKVWSTNHGRKSWTSR